MTFKQLESFARERGYTVRRKKRREIYWIRNIDHKINGFCDTLRDTKIEMQWDWESIGKNNAQKEKDSEDESGATA
jgi:hypothetical protein